MSTMYNLIWTYQKALPFWKHGVPPSRPGCWVYPDMLEVGIGLSTLIGSIYRCKRIGEAAGSRARVPPASDTNAVQHRPER